MPRPDPAGGDSTIDEGRSSGEEIGDEVAAVVDRSGDRSDDLRAEPEAGSDRTRRDRASDLDGDLVRARGDRPISDLARDRLEIGEFGHLGASEGEAEDEDEVWFEAEVLAAASMVELGVVGSTGHGLLDHPSGLASITAGLAVPSLSLASLPGWPGGPAAGQGLGELGEAWLGRLGPGDLVLLTGAARGVGRTSLLAQLGDGLALLDGPERHPVVFVSPEPPASWRARTLGRYFGVDPRTFLPGSGPGSDDLGARLAVFAEGPWAAIDEYQRFVGPTALTDPDTREGLVEGLRRWQGRLGQGWPVVIVDPIVAVGAELAELVGSLARLAATEGWTVLASADLDDRAELGLARVVDGCASVRLRAAPLDDETLALELCHRRLGPRTTRRLAWARASGRFEALGDPDELG